MDDSSGLPIEQMIMDARAAIKCYARGSPIHRERHADLGCHVLALIAALERKPKTLVRRPGGQWDAFDLDADAAEYQRAAKGRGEHPEGFNVSSWQWHRCRIDRIQEVSPI